MKLGRISTLTVAVATAIAAMLFMWTLVQAVYYDPDSYVADVATSTAPVVVPPGALPARLEIPSLNIHASVQDLGINAAGAMQAPDNFVDVGWYKYGVPPGYTGSAVIDGHVDNGLGLNGVFKYLDNIKVGDDVYVVTQGGYTLHFVVTDIEVYPYTDAPTDLIFGQDDAARLNLITCDGTWVNGKDTYNERLVVFTTLADS
jgi:sortase A